MVGCAAAARNLPRLEAIAASWPQRVRDLGLPVELDASGITGYAARGYALVQAQWGGPEQIWGRAESFAKEQLRARSASSPQSAERYQRLDMLAALWSSYEYRYIQDGRVISLDEDEITTSEGQSYGMLRAVWSRDRETFDQIWKWTKDHLRVRGDHLFAWKWKDGVLDVNSATDADTDIAMALILAARRFEAPDYEREALEVIRDIWELEILPAGNAFYPTAGDWTRRDPIAVVHIGYLAPYAYQEFAKVDPEHPWDHVVDTSYAILNWLFFESNLQFPPEKIYVDAKTGRVALA
ncbi:MAG: glycosyl hydrolase family 8, partial [Myxococcota bacterium]